MVQAFLIERNLATSSNLHMHLPSDPTILRTYPKNTSPTTQKYVCQGYLLQHCLSSQNMETSSVPMYRRMVEYTTAHPHNGVISKICY